MRLISRRVILAATRLALIYVALVVLEDVILHFAYRLGIPSLDVIGEMALWLSIPFGGSFVLLAVARRWGLLALWLILGGCWMYLQLHYGEIWSLDTQLFRASSEAYRSGRGTLIRPAVHLGVT